MNFQFLNRPLGSESLPFGQIKRYNGFGALADGVMTLFNWAREDQQRNENFAYNNFWNQKNFDENQRQFEANMNWQKEQFAKQREYALDERRYQDPAAQVKRLRDAGINPALAFGSGSMPTPSVSSVGGASGSSGSSASAPSLSSPASFNFASDIATESNARSQALLANASSRRELAAAANLEIKNRLDEESLQHDLLGRINAARKGTVEYERAQEDLAYFRAVKGYREQLESGRLTLQSEEYKQAVERTNQMVLQTSMMKIQEAYAPKLNEAQLAQYWTTVKQLQAQIGLLGEQSATEVEKRAGMIVDKNLKGFDLQLKKELKQYIIKNIRNESEMLDFERRNQKSGERLKRLSSVIPFASGYVNGQGQRAAGSKAYNP